MAVYAQYENGVITAIWGIEGGSFIPLASDGWVDITNQNINSLSAVPSSVTAAQARVALLAQPGSEPGKTLLDDANAACTAAGGDIQIYWEYGTEIHRDSPMLASVAHSLNLTSDQIDALFIAASKL